MLVFGYGTLRKDYFPGWLVENTMRFVGPATMKGELWVIDGGPTYGIWAGVDRGEGEVFGHVFEGEEHTLAALDRRERCNYGTPEASVYHREQVEVEIDGVTVGDVWVYMIAGAARKVQRVASGNWDDRPEWLDAGTGSRIK